MLDWNQLHQNLERASNRHRQLFAKFEAFAKFVDEQVSALAFHIKGIGIREHMGSVLTFQQAL